MRAARIALFGSGLLLILTQSLALFVESERAARVSARERETALRDARALLPRVAERAQRQGSEPAEIEEAWLQPFDRLQLGAAAPGDDRELGVRIDPRLEAVIVEGVVTRSTAPRTFALFRRCDPDAFLNRRALFLHGLTFVGAIAGLLLTAFPTRTSREGASASLRAYELAMSELGERDHSREREFARERARLESTLRDRETMARAGELVAGIVHEVRNSLGAIVARAHAIGGRDADADRRAADSVVAESRHLESVIQRFLELLKDERPEIGSFDLARLVERVVARERGESTARVELRTDPGVVSGDEALLSRALENVVRNAIEAAGPRGTVTVHSGVRAGEAFVVVEDDGPGFPADPADLGRPFRSLRPGGTGLGLSLAIKMLQFHGGSVRLGASVGGGARVLCAWPQIATEGNAPDAGSREA